MKIKLIKQYKGTKQVKCLVCGRYSASEYEVYGRSMCFGCAEMVKRTNTIAGERIK